MPSVTPQLQHYCASARLASNHRRSPAAVCQRSNWSSESVSVLEWNMSIWTYLLCPYMSIFFFKKKKIGAHRWNAVRCRRHVICFRHIYKLLQCATRWAIGPLQVSHSRRPREYCEQALLRSYVESPFFRPTECRCIL